MLRLFARCGDIARVVNFLRSFARFSFDSKMQM